MAHYLRGFLLKPLVRATLSLCVGKPRCTELLKCSVAGDACAQAILLLELCEA